MGVGVGSGQTELREGRKGGQGWQEPGPPPREGEGGHSGLQAGALGWLSRGYRSELQAAVPVWARPGLVVSAPEALQAAAGAGRLPRKRRGIFTVLPAPWPCAVRRSVPRAPRLTSRRKEGKRCVSAGALAFSLFKMRNVFPGGPAAVCHCVSSASQVAGPFHPQEGRGAKHISPGLIVPHYPSAQSGVMLLREEARAAAGECVRTPGTEAQRGRAPCLAGAGSARRSLRRGLALSSLCSQLPVSVSRAPDHRFCFPGD